VLRLLSRESVTHELDKQRIQILPPRIELLDQPDLPRPAPAFDRLLPLESRDDLLMALEVDQPLQPVSLSKTGNRSDPVLINPSKHIRRHAYVKRPVRSGRHDIDVTTSHAEHYACISSTTHRQNI
jgi:hypothetical protein